MGSPSNASLTKLSIIVPVYNGAKFVEEAIDSITVSNIPYEIIVIDDASTDNTPEIVRELQLARKNLRYRRLSRSQGPASARNMGLALAEGDVLGFLDSDDIYAPGALDLMLQRLAGREGIDLAMGRVRAYRSKDGSEQLGSYEADDAAVRIYQLGSILVRRDLIERFGQFDTAFRYCEDVDWFFRLQEGNARFELIDDVVVYYRRHADSMTARGQDRIFHHAAVIRASITRRRKIADESGRKFEEIYYVLPDALSIEDE